MQPQADTYHRDSSLKCLSVVWQFPPTVGRQQPPLPLLGQQSILISLGQQSRMPMRQQQFLIFYKEMLAIETTVYSFYQRNSYFHQPWLDNSPPCFYQDTSPLQTKGWKARTTISLQTNSRKQGQHSFESNEKK